jgi:hypothetical protein
MSKRHDCDAEVVYAFEPYSARRVALEGDVSAGASYSACLMDRRLVRMQARAVSGRAAIAEVTELVEPYTSIEEIVGWRVKRDG